MTIVDLIKDLIDTSKERLKNPISGAFIWSFLIYNWRPIVELLFSKVSIEDRIYIIDQEYCRLENILWPIGFALFYTVILPFIMWVFDWPVVYGKKLRLAKIYEDKKNKLDEKMKIATKVLELKNKESGNKEKQNLLDENESLKGQIISLKESLLQINESNKTTIDRLNEQIKDSNNERNQLILQHSKSAEEYKFRSLQNTIIGDTLGLDKELANKVLIIANTLDFKEYIFLRENDASKIENLKPGDNSYINIISLAQKQIIKRNKDGKNTFTEIGNILYEIIKTT